MQSRRQRQHLRGIDVPYERDSVLSPRVVYGLWAETYIEYVTAEDEPIRVTFESLDAIRICRGEYLPYPWDDFEEGRFFSVFVVELSRWLRERHRYESKHYRDCYEFGGDVDEMLTDFDHYLFSFHDEFVEAIAAGIWFEKDPPPIIDGACPVGHPLAPLGRDAKTGSIGVGGERFDVRANPKSHDEIVWGARYCSQPLYEFALEGEERAALRIEVRTRRDRPRSVLRGFLHRKVAALDGVATLDQANALVEPFLREISDRRREMARRSTLP